MYSARNKINFLCYLGEIGDLNLEGKTTLEILRWGNSKNAIVRGIGRLKIGKQHRRNLRTKEMCGK